MEVTWRAETSTYRNCCIFIILRLTLAHSLAAERLINVSTFKFAPGVSWDAGG